MARIPRKSMNRLVRERVEEIGKALMVGREPKMNVTRDRKKIIRVVLAQNLKKIAESERKKDLKQLKRIAARHLGSQFFGEKRERHFVFIGKKQVKEAIAGEAAHVAYGEARRLQKRKTVSPISEAFDIFEEYVDALKKRDEKKIAKMRKLASEAFLLVWGNARVERSIADYVIGRAIMFSAVANGFDSVEKIRNLELLLSRKEFKKSINLFGFIQRIGKEMQKDPKYLDRLIERAKQKGALREL